MLINIQLCRNLAYINIFMIYLFLYVNIFIEVISMDIIVSKKIELMGIMLLISDCKEKYLFRRIT